jgi:predicted Zn-dependent peptidase
MAAVNILYDVGSRDEEISRTGFAHLFEHLMFGGSARVANFDAELQKAGGSNNAFTSPDITNYYDVLPASNLETAFWLEADRMDLLNFSERSLEVQRKVVCEEFKEHYINRPYGDHWHKLMALSYKKHPYQWPTIGLELSHIEDASLEDVKDFFYRYYRPNNAILVVSGGVKEQEVLKLAEKWFGPIPSGPQLHRNLPKEPEQNAARFDEVRAKVPVDAFYKAYHMSARRDEKFYAGDLISDILSGGESGRLQQKLVKEKELFSNIDAYITSSLDEGLLVVEGHFAAGVDREKAMSAVQEELNLISNQLVSDEELEKVRNQSEASEAFNLTSILSKAMKLAYYELLDDAARINTEVGHYRAVEAVDIQREAQSILKEENSNTLFYLSES